MKKKIAIAMLIVAGILIGTKAWLNSEIKEVNWAIELAGGMKALTSNNAPLLPNMKSST